VSVPRQRIVKNQSDSVRSPDFELLDALSTAVVLLDAKSQVIRVNAAAKSLIATSEGMVHGQTLSEVLPGTEELSKKIQRSIAEGRSFSERGVLFRPSKPKDAAVHCTVTPIWQGGPEPEFVVVEIKDIERHPGIQLEDNLVIQKEITSPFLGGMAHEIKNPLGGIRGAAQLLERELQDQKQEEYTQIIIGEVDRLRALVDRMLSPFGEPRKTELNIHNILEHVRQLAKAENEYGVEFMRDYDPSLPEIFADRDQLIQAFLNLVSNAIQSTNHSGSCITLRTRVERQFTIRAKLHRLVVLAEVVDDGPGVDPEIESSIFLPMVSSRPDGSGLGLPLAQLLVHRQGGSIGFESVPGRTTFSVWLPVSDGDHR